MLLGKNYLNDAIRTGEPLRKRGTAAEKARSYAGLARSLHVVNWEPAQKAAQILVAAKSALGNIVHSEGERFSRELLVRVHRSLKERGRIAIIEIIPDEERSGPQASLIMALAMLLDTEEGDLFILSEYRRWLEEAGFVEIQTADIGSHSPMILAHKG